MRSLIKEANPSMSLDVNARNLIRAWLKHEKDVLIPAASYKGVPYTGPTPDELRDFLNRDPVPKGLGIDPSVADDLIKTVTKSRQFAQPSIIKKAAKSLPKDNVADYTDNARFGTTRVRAEVRSIDDLSPAQQKLYNEAMTMINKMKRSQRRMLAKELQRYVEDKRYTWAGMPRKRDT